MQDFKNKKVVVMGLGIYEKGSGISSALFFAKQGADVLITDLKSRKELAEQLKRLKRFKNIKYVLGKHRKQDFKEADFIFQNPSVPRDSVYLKTARKNKIPVINDWTVFFDNFNNFLIGITGTRGKSTTTSLIYRFLKTKHKHVLLCGNIGNSPLGNRIAKNTIVVAEFSSWLLQGFKKKSPNIAVLTNLLVDHQDKYKSLNQYYRDKDNIFKFQKKHDYLVVNKDNKQACKRAKTAKSQVIWFSKKFFPKVDGVYVKNNNIYFRRKGKQFKICEVKDIKLIGDHNLENVLSAIAVASILKVSKIKQVLSRFKGIPNRLEFIREIRGVKYYNDTTATTPDGTIAALRALKNEKIILLAGGYDKNLDFKKYVREIDRVKAVIFFKGTATDKIIKLFKKEYIIVSSMKEAMEKARKTAEKGDIVLLSPGAASFGMFKNEFDRGEQFKKWIK